MDNDGNPLKSDFTKLHRALPQQFDFLIRSILAHQTIKPQRTSLSLQGLLILDKKFNKHYIRNSLSLKNYFHVIIPHKFDRKIYHQTKNNVVTTSHTTQSKSNTLQKKDLEAFAFGFDNDLYSIHGRETETTGHVFCTFLTEMPRRFKDRILANISIYDVTFGVSKINNCAVTQPNVSLDSLFTES